MNNKHLVVIVGPTGIGKTGVSINLAKLFSTEIISADSRQFYRELKIGTASPTKKQLKEIQHRFVGHLSIHDYYNASMFEQDVIRLLEKLFEENRIVIMTGGSGLYIEAVCSGIDELPTINTDIRKTVLKRYEKEGIEGIRMQLKKIDPAYYAKVDLKNPARIMKALEVQLITGRNYSSFLTHSKKERWFKIHKIGLDMPRDKLYDRINNRVDRMIEMGLVDEAKPFVEFRELNALNTVGYKEIFDHLEEQIPLENAVELIKRNTRKYARRQLTWFRKDKTTKWFHPDEVETMIQYIQQVTRE